MISTGSNISGLKINTRRLAAVIGILLVVFGEYLIARAGALFNPTTPLGTWLINFLHLDMPSIDSVLGGILCLLAGGGLLVVALRGLRIYSPEEALPNDEPIRINLIRPSWLQAIIPAVLFLGLLCFQLRKLEYSSFSPWLWITSLIIFSVVIAKWDYLRDVNLSPNLTRKDLIWLLGLLIMGLLILTYRLQGWPDQLMTDEGIFGSTARDIANKVLIPPVFGQGVDTIPIFGSIWQGWVMRLFGVNIWGWRFASVLPGVMSIVPLFLLARDAFNRRVAIISSAILLTIPYFLVYSRLGYTNIQPAFLITLTIYLLYSGLHKTSSLYLYLAGGTAGLGFYTYFSGRSALLVGILFIVLLWLTRKLRFRKFVLAMLLFALGVALVAIPHMIYGINQDSESMVYRTFLSFFNSVAYGSAYYPNAELIKYAPIFQLGGIDLFFNPKIYLILILRGFVQTLLPYLKSGMLWGQHYLACPLTGTIGAVFYLIGILVSLKNAKEPRFQLVLLWLVTVATVLSALNTFPPREDHMVPIVPALALLMGLGLDALPETIASIFGWFNKYKNVILAILLVPIMVGGLYDYFVTGPRNFAQRPEDIMSWAGLNSHGESFLYVYDVPIRQDFVPYVMSEFRKDIQFNALQISEFAQGNEIFQGRHGSIVFYPPGLDSVIRPILQARWGNTLISKTFVDSTGSPVLMAGMNTPFLFERDRPFLNTLSDAFHQLPFVVLILVLMILFALVIFSPVLKMRLPVLEKLFGSS